MALAEARAAWQRTANRCIVQEDAKRAPKLACCPPTYAKNTETEPKISDNGQDIIIPNTAPLSPSHTNLSPSSRWWLQTQPNYGYQKVPMDETCRNPESLEGFSCDFSKSGDDFYFDSESAWIGAERNSPWWRTADTGELALLVARRSVDVLENCDLPSPLNNARVKKDAGVNIRCISRNDDEIKPGIGSLVAGNCSPKLGKSVDDRLVFSADMASRDSPTHDKKPESDSSRAQLLEALCHSQTRAREAEEVMKHACAEKEHVVKLVLRQASQLFAYKQWVHLLQLENMYFKFKHSKVESAPSPWTAAENRSTRKSWRKSLNRKRAKKARTRCDVGKYAIIFALGLGLVGAGLLLGWTIGWMLPATWCEQM